MSLKNFRPYGIGFIAGSLLGMSVEGLGDLKAMLDEGAESTCIEARLEKIPTGGSLRIDEIRQMLKECEQN